MPRPRGSTTLGLRRGKTGAGAVGNTQNEYANSEEVDVSSFMDTEPVEDVDEVMDTSGDEDENDSSEEEDRASVLDDDDDGKSEDSNDESDDCASVLDTEPFQDVDMEASSSGEEDEDRRQHATIKPTPGSMVSLDDSLMLNSETEYEEENTSAAAPDISCAGPFEVKRIYTELIDTCRKYDDEGITAESERVLKENIFTGHSLFQQLESSLSETLNESHANSDKSKGKRTKDNGVSLGNTAGEILLSCVHTNLCATMLRQKVKSLGVTASSFRIEIFLKAMKKKTTNSDGYHSVLDTAINLAKANAAVSQTGPKYAYMMGALNKEDFEIRTAKAPKAEPPVVKEKKVRVRHKEEGDNTPTQMEVINNDVTAGSSQDVKRDAPEALAKEVFKTLKKACRDNNGQPQFLLDVAYGEENGNTPSLNDIVGRGVGAAFVVRDGCMAVSAPDDCEGREASALLKLEPAKPPPPSLNNETRRNQTIFSFSAVFLKNF